MKAERRRKERSGDTVEEVEIQEGEVEEVFPSSWTMKKLEEIVKLGQDEDEERERAEGGEMLEED